MKQHRFYLLGRHFVTFCDHKPLVPFYNNTKKPTPRVEKHMLSIQDLKYKMNSFQAKRIPSTGTPDTQKTLVPGQKKKDENMMWTKGRK